MIKALQTSYCHTRMLGMCIVYCAAIAVSILHCAPSVANETNTYSQSDGSFTTANYSSATIASGMRLDWVPYSKDNPAPHGQCMCDGEYIEPANTHPDVTLSPQKAPLYLSADQGQSMLNDEIRFEGNVAGAQGSMRLSADQLTYNKATEDIFLKGNVQIREPGSLILGKQARLNRVNRSAELEDASYVIHDNKAHGSAKQVSRNTKQQIQLQEASYSLCEPHNNDWELRASKILLDTKNSEGFAKHARLYVKDVPVFYFPYFKFPISDKRKSGFLFPSIASSGSGLDLTVPYYLNLAPHYDATLIPRYISDYGLLMGSELRYLHPNSRVNVGGSILYNNQTSNTRRDEEEQRWLVYAKEEGKLGSHQRWSHYIDFQRVSDNDYFRDLGTSGLDVRREAQLQSSAALAYHADNWYARSYIENYQNLEDNLEKAYSRVPQLEGQYRTALSPNTELKLFGDMTHFEHRELDGGQRVYTEPAIRYIQRSPSHEASVKVGVKSVHFYTSDDIPSSQEHTTSPNINAQAKFFLEKALADSGRSIIEPHIMYYYAHAEDQDAAPLFDTAEVASSFQQFFREERFSGLDRISDANRVTLGLSNKLYNKHNRNIFELGIAQQFYFQNNSVSPFDPDTLTAAESAALKSRLHRNQSDFATYININKGEHWRINSEYLLQPGDLELNSASINANWRKNDSYSQLVNLGYQFKKSDGLRDPVTGVRNLANTNQIHVSSIQAINNKISAIAAVNYDLNDNRGIEEMIGLEYNSCCWKSRLLYHREAEVDNATAINTGEITGYDHAIRFEVQLKGFSSISDSLSSILDETIEGFSAREKYYQ